MAEETETGSADNLQPSSFYLICEAQDTPSSQPEDSAGYSLAINKGEGISLQNVSLAEAFHKSIQIISPLVAFVSQVSIQSFKKSLHATG